MSMPPQITDYDTAQRTNIKQTLSAQVQHISGQKVELCFQCHKCSAGCPIVDAMLFSPDRILRMVALNQRDAVLCNRDIWLCVGCFTCGTRCPNNINICAVMDALRQVAVTEGYSAGERDAFLFHRLFLSVVEYLGRSHEAIMLGMFKLLSQVPILSDMKAGLGLFLRGKIPILPPRSGAVAEVRRIYQRSK
jgi:heterodisulfide reductase subunit C